MSTNTDDARDDGAPNYDNPEAKERLDQYREEVVFADDDAEELAQNAAIRRTVAEEDQPGMPEEAPDLRETYTVTFRGYDFEFYELGDAQTEAAKFDQMDDDVETGTKAAAFVYETLGEKATAEWADEAYWRDYDMGAVMELFTDLVNEATDVDPEEAEDIGEFRGE